MAGGWARVSWTRPPRLLARGCGYSCSVESFRPIAQTRDALEELAANQETPEGWLEALLSLAEHARGLVPDLVGVSIARRQAGLTFTLVATDEQIKALDAVQYVAGGPCVDGAEDLEAIQFDVADPLDEGRWAVFARATAASGIRSTLTLQIVAPEGRVQGSVNLYAAGDHAFDGKHHLLATVFGADATAVVANADLSFRTLDEARRAPQVLQQQAIVDLAVGVLVAETGDDPEDARRNLEQAAAQAGTDVVRLAHEVVAALLDDLRDDDGAHGVGEYPEGDEPTGP